MTQPAAASSDNRIPLPVWVIGAAIFAQGTSELMLAGLLPELSRDLSVSIPHAGLLVSVFALGMLVGAPVLAVATLRAPSRLALLGFLAVFIAGHVVSGLTDSFGVLLAMRFVSAFVYAGFWAVGSATAIALTPVQRRGRAMSIVAGGLTLASVIGLPLGTWLGQQAGWRSAFWAVAVATVLVTVAVAALVPGIPPTRASVTAELRGLLTPRLWLSYAITAVCTAAMLAPFTYLGAMLITDADAAESWVPIVLLGYGVGALAAIVVGGHAADRWPRGTLVTGFASLAVVTAVMSTLTHSLLATGVLAVLLGLAGFSTNPALGSRAFALAPSSPTLVAAGTTSGFNVGIAVGPWLAGLSLSAGHGYSTVPAIGTVLALMALALVALDTRLARTGAGRATPSTAPTAVCID